jgi:hypothetical protein
VFIVMETKNVWGGTSDTYFGPFATRQEAETFITNMEFISSKRPADTRYSYASIKLTPPPPKPT